jgi:hypothetical protein
MVLMAVPDPYGKADPNIESLSIYVLCKVDYFFIISPIVFSPKNYIYAIVWRQ